MRKVEEIFYFNQINSEQKAENGKDQGKKKIEEEEEEVNIEFNALSSQLLRQQQSLSAFSLDTATAKRKERKTKQNESRRIAVTRC